MVKLYRENFKRLFVRDIISQAQGGSVKTE